MIYRKLDENGDYTFGNNAQAYISDLEAVRQAISTRLKLLLYEWWENLEDGLPLWQEILAKRDIEKAKKLIRERIEGTEKVKNVIYFSADWDNKHRHLKIYAFVDTEYGQTEISEVIN